MKLFFRELLRQHSLLPGYLEGRLPEWEEIELGLYLAEHARDHTRPDHFLRAARRALGTIGTLADGLTRALTETADDYLYPCGGRRLCIRTERFGEWQNALLDIPPLPIVARGLLGESGGLPEQMARDDVRQFIARNISPQVRHSSLPTVHDPRLDYLIRTHGLDEMHMHLNGSTEVEPVWLDALADIRGFTRQLLKAMSKGGALELFQQEERGFNPAGLVERLKFARVMRAELAERTLRPLAGDRPPSRVADHRVSREEAFSRWRAYELQYPQRLHPVDAVFGPVDAPLLARETFFLMIIMQALKTRRDDYLAHLFYAYLLVNAQFARLLVQQRNQWGFDQFQKITLNEMREKAEASYTHRFHQLSYTVDGDLDLLEGRYAPKGDETKMIALFTAILAGYHAYHGGQPADRPTLSRLLKSQPETLSTKRLRLGLVGHFVKAEDEGHPNRVTYACRHYALRQTLDRQAQVLANVIQRFAGLRRYLTGFDAAANELHASPEVFAPVYRRLRRYGFANFSYHVGEDFVHLLSGIRAVYEALHFLDLGPGHRLGHATALGIDPSLWRRRIGRTLLVNRGDRLDDLVVARRMLLELGLPFSARFEDETSRLSREIYGTSHAPELLFQAWKLRSLDPRVALDLIETEHEPLDSALRSERNLVDEARQNKEAFSVFCRYHGANGEGAIIERSREPIAIQAEDDLSDDLLFALQESVLKDIARRRVAIETLPTSNVRISLYEDHSEHHVLRWLGLKGGAPVNVCVGSDDPGIFATNLRNEYAHLMREIEAQCLRTTHPTDAITLIEGLIKTGKIWRFNPAPAEERFVFEKPVGESFEQ